MELHFIISSYWGRLVWLSLPIALPEMNTSGKFNPMNKMKQLSGEAELAFGKEGNRIFTFKYDFADG